MNARLEQLRDPLVAAQALGSYLRHGQLGLFLGAGISAGLGLPQWGELVAACEVAASLAVGRPDDTAESFLRRMDAVRLASGDRFLGLVRTCLYGDDLVRARTYPSEIVNLPMLGALGALVMSSSRGSVADVFTLNFDDVLDWYLHLHGFRSQSIGSLPQLVDGAADVRIYHLHGYLPLNERHESSPSIVLTRQQFVGRLAEDSAEPWPALMLTTLMSKVLLIAGTSLNDVDVAQLVERARRRVDGRRPLAFALTVGLDEQQAQVLMESTVVPVTLGSHAEVPEFLLSVCRQAADE